MFPEIDLPISDSNLFDSLSRTRDFRSGVPSVRSPGAEGLVILEFMLFAPSPRGFHGAFGYLNRVNLDRQILCAFVPHPFGSSPVCI